MEELWNEEQFQGGDLSIHLVPGLRTLWHHLTAHIKQDRKVTGDTIRSWRISLASENNTSNNRSECSTCQINTRAPDTLGNDIPSANLHVKGLHFVERITGVGSNPRRAAMEEDNTDPQTDPNIRFQVVVRGWSDQNQQTRAKTLLALPTDKMVTSLQHHQDILLIPRDW